jgi:CelD/BcsL family acetyltransferase involved in cellulose biosynthesis
MDNRIAASQLSVRVGRTLFLLKIAYDEQLAYLSPGNVLMANLVESCCEDPDVDRIDCTVWQPWHQRWGMTREPTFRFTAFNSRSVRGALAGVAWNARRHLVHRRQR